MNNLISSKDTIASATQLGHVKVGNSMDITSEGVLNVNQAVYTHLGGVRVASISTDYPEKGGYANVSIIDGDNNNKSIIFVPPADATTSGVVKPTDTQTSLPSYYGKVVEVLSSTKSQTGKLYVPVASSTEFGVIKPGTNCSVSNTGNLNVTIPEQLPYVFNLTSSNPDFNEKFYWYNNDLVLHPDYGVHGYPSEVERVFSDLTGKWTNIIIKIPSSENSTKELMPVAFDRGPYYYAILYYDYSTSTLYKVTNLSL